ncbi:MAG: V-type ATP synthase subunit I, partial [Lachnospiraceae bacterium]|nr:V-type ATP synthase subunit I [Lachnospiraceae bacterium]
RFEQLFADNIPQADYRMLITEVKEKDIPDVPIKLQNNKVVTVYERLTEMYSMPRYNELDPTPVMTVFYLLFFGLMVADVGYGLAVFLIGLLVRKVLKVKRSTKNFVSFLYYLSFPMMGWGLVFGSFFGLDLPFGLIRATVDIVPLIILSVCLGFLHIMAGLVIHMVNQARLKNYGDMLTGGLAWFLVFLGGAAMIVGKMAFDIPILFLVGAVVLGVGLALVIVVPAIQYGKRWYLGLGKGLYALYGATSYLGDFVSYTRLMALGVAGGSVALAFNTILSFLPLPAKMTIGVVLAVGLHALNMFLSMLSAYVHGIRLQFIEFFGKFYEGGGKRFEPFKTAEKNVIIND